MTAIATADAAEPNETDGGRLAEEIARAMHNRPLMSRLARVGNNGGQGGAAQPRPDATLDASRLPPPSPQDDAPPGPALTASIEELIADVGRTVTGTPPSADWLRKAKSERRRDRMRNVAAWFTTLGIAAAIVGSALFMLRA